MEFLYLLVRMSAPFLAFDICLPQSSVIHFVTQAEVLAGAFLLDYIFEITAI